MTDIKRVEKDILSDIGKMNDEFEVIRAKYQSEAQKKIKSVFAEVFQDFPDLKIIWSQYTPSWNDGEECTFRTSEPIITNLDDERLIEAIESRQHDYDGDDEDVFGGYGDFVPDPNFVPSTAASSRVKYVPTIEVDLEEARTRPYFWIGPGFISDETRSPLVFKNAPKAAVNKLKKLLDLIYSSRFEDVMEQTFGDGSYVVATIGGFEIDEYSDE